MTLLEAGSLLDRTLPASSAWVISALFEIDELKNGAGPGKEARKARATELYSQLLAGLRSLHEPTPPEHLHTSGSFRRWFTEAVLLWIRFAKTGPAPFVDSVRAQNLREFAIDLPLSGPESERVKDAVRRAFDWNAEEFSAIERNVERLTSNLELKRSLTSALAAELTRDGPPSPEARLRLMSEFYGELPLRPGDVDVLVVATAVFFFLPRKGGELDVPDWNQRDAAEQQRVREFLLRLDGANSAETRRFPAFGLYEPERMSRDLIARLCKAAGVPRGVVQATIGTMFSTLPKAVHAQYLVHDLWGHTWQEALNEFEWEYELLPALDRPLSPSDGPAFGGEDTPTLGSAFVVRNGGVVLDEARLFAFGEADLRGRIQVATSVPFSEVLADFMESKFSRARPKLELPTSSLIPPTRLKIDLTIADTRAQIRRLSRPYHALAVDTDAQERLAWELEATGLPRPGLHTAVVRAGRSLWLKFAPAFDDTLRPEPIEGERGEIRSSVMRRLLLQFALIMADFERMLDCSLHEPSAKEAWRNPANSADFFAVAFAHFYQQNRQHNFFFIDQVARNEFVPACSRLKQALSG
jgi:hypothetical protein